MVGTVMLQKSKMFRCPHLTAVQEVEVDSLGMGFEWLTVPQAAAAMVGLLLPRRHTRTRCSLAFLATVSTIAAHCMFIRVAVVMVASNPTVLACVDTIALLAGDLLSILSLLIRGPISNISLSLGPSSHPPPNNVINLQLGAEGAPCIM